MGARITKHNPVAGWMELQVGPWTHEVPIAEFKRMQRPHEGTTDAVARVARVLEGFPIEKPEDVDAANLELARVEAAIKEGTR